MDSLSKMKARVRHTAALLGALALLAAGSALAQGQELTPNYRDTDIRQVIEAVAAVTHRRFLVDPRVRANVTLITDTPMSVDAFYQAFLATLAVHGYVAIPSGAVVKIVPDANARQDATNEELGGGTGDEFVTQVVKVQNVGAAQLVPILRPLMPQYAHLVAHPQSNMLVIADRAANVKRILAIVHAMDRSADTDVEVIPLKNASADEVVRMLSALSQQSSQAAGGVPTAQVVADERTNSVLLSGSQSERLKYRGLIAYLDEPTQTGGDTRVRYLNYADAKDLAAKLQAQFGGQGATAAAGAKGAPAAQQQGVTIWADQGTNALVINAPAKVLKDMMAVIDKIDIPRAQVAVDAIIVELTEQKAAQLGVTWVSNGSGSSPILGLTNFGSTIPGVVQLGTAAQGSTPSAASIPDGVTIGVGKISDTGTSWAALISALRGDGTTNVISTPHIVTLDNQEAEIRVGQEVPFVTGQFTNTGGSNAAGVVNPFQTIQREEVGTNLKITPQINEGSGVKLTIEQETSSISAGATGAVDLVTNKRTISTSVFVEDGQVLVLGGLMDNQLTQNDERVPGLGRIPGLGWLFRARKTNRTKTNLMVFIRPTILRTNEQSRFLTDTKYNYIRNLQQQEAQKRVHLMREEKSPVLPALPPPAKPAKPAGQKGGAAAPNAAPGSPGGAAPQGANPGASAPAEANPEGTSQGAAGADATGAAPGSTQDTEQNAAPPAKESRRSRRRRRRANGD